MGRIGGKRCTSDVATGRQFGKDSEIWQEPPRATSSFSEHVMSVAAHRLPKLRHGMPPPLRRANVPPRVVDDVALAPLILSGPILLFNQNEGEMATAVFIPTKRRRRGAF